MSNEQRPREAPILGVRPEQIFPLRLPVSCPDPSRHEPRLVHLMDDGKRLSNLRLDAEQQLDEAYTQYSNGEIELALAAADNACETMRQIMSEMELEAEPKR